MRTSRVLLPVFIVPILALSLPASGAAASAIPGYIAGQVGFPGFTTTSVSITAVGSGNTVQKTTYDSPTYQVAVPGGSGDYSVTASCGLSGGNNSAITVSFNQRRFPVAAGAWVANDYNFTPGIVRFQVSITGDETMSSASVGSWATKAVTEGEKTATFSSGTPPTAARSYSWDLPVVPNQQIDLAANIDVHGLSGMKRYSFHKAAASPYTLAPTDVAPGEILIISLEIYYDENQPAPPSSAYKGYVAGRVHLLGLSEENFARHAFSAQSIYDNPGTYLRSYNMTGPQYIASVGTPNTYFDDSLDGTSLRWPYVNGDSSNNRVAVYPDTTSYFDAERAGGYLRGAMNFLGTNQNQDLKAITMNFVGVGNLYDAITKKWYFGENYYGSAIVRRDAILSNVKRPSERDYKLFLTIGDWEVNSITLSKQMTAPSRTSSVTFSDHTNRYNGQNYFGTPIHIAQGTNERDFNYCLGSAVFRFWDPEGRLLRNPSVTGNGNQYAEGAVDLSVSSIWANSSSTDHVAMPEVEVFGPPADYRFGTIRVAAADGTTITFPARNLSLSCNTTKVLDFPGPTLVVQDPAGEMITTAQSLSVSGRAFGGSAMAGVTVNGEPAVLWTLSGGSPNEVAFEHGVALAEGENFITVTATEGTGAQATDQLRVLVDRWQPMVSILSPADGGTFFDGAAGIPLRIEAADRGYGYALTVALNGNPIHTAQAGANGDFAEDLVYEEVLRGLAIGGHVVTATALDRAGNSTTASVTLYMQVPPPVLHGLADQTLEATSGEGAAATFTVTATTTCDPDPAPAFLRAPVVKRQTHSVSFGGELVKVFEWEAVSSQDGQGVEYQVEVSDTLDFSAIEHRSSWQTGTSWAQALPVGIWYWRVTARGSVYTELWSSPATGNSFSILSGGAATAKFPVQNHTDITFSGGVYPNPGDAIWVGPFTEDGEHGDVDRSFLTFDTSSLSEGTDVTAAKLHLDYQYNAYVEATSTTNVYASAWEFPGTRGTYGDLGDLLASSPPIARTRPLGLIPFAVPPEHIRTGGLTKFGLAAAVEDFGYPANAAPGYSRSTSFLEVTFAPEAALETPLLFPQANLVSDGEDVEAVLAWDEVASADGNPVEYRVELSSFPSFSTVAYSSRWLAETVWIQTLPIGAWHWRVTARDAVKTGLVSEPASSSFVVAYQPPPTPPGEVSVACEPSSGGLFPLGVTTVSCGALDACGGWAEGTFQVTVVNATPLELTAPSDRTVEATGLLTPVEIGEAGAGGMQPIVVYHNGPAAYPVGTTVVTWTATDGNGNTATATQNITVTDTTAPAVTPPEDRTAEATGPLTPVDVGQATAADAVGVASLTHDAPGAFPVGVTTVTWTATDAAGNAGTAIQTITVTDETPPVLAGLADLTLEAASPAGAAATFTVTATDLVDPYPVVTCAPASGSIFPLGEFTVTCAAADAGGNSTTGTFTITVRDTTPPVLTVPGILTVLLNTPLGSPEVQAFLGGATATDAVDGSVAVTAAAPEVFDTVGEIPVTFTAVDASGNESAGTAVIRVVYGCGESFLSPVSLGKPFKQGSTVPVKIAFCDASGAAVTPATVRLFLYPVSDDVPAEEPIEIQATGSEDSGNLFRLTEDHYQYNLSTRNLSAGSYQIRAAPDDGTFRTAPLALK